MVDAGPTTAADLLVVNGDIVTMDADRRVLLGGAIAVGGDRIIDIGGTSELRRRWPGVSEHDAAGGVVHPGLINTPSAPHGIPPVPQRHPRRLTPGGVDHQMGGAAPRQRHR